MVFGWSTDSMQKGALYKNCLAIVYTGNCEVENSFMIVIIFLGKGWRIRVGWRWNSGWWRQQ